MLQTEPKKESLVSAMDGTGWRICHSLEEWELIHQEGVDLLIWKRPAPGLLATRLESMSLEDLPRGRFTTTPQQARADLAARLDEVDSICPTFKELWLEELDALLQHFARVMGALSVGVRLDQLTTDGCSRFHIDNTTVRMLCTYKGPSSQWLSSDNIYRPRDRRDRFNEEDIQHITRWSVGLLKGHRHPTHTNKIYHRSPPIAQQGLSRFVFCLDHEG